MNHSEANEVSSDASLSPFHSGEKTLQQRAGKREAMERFGRQAIRSYMPEQHRTFFSQLPFLVVGSVDAAGWPWASILPGRPGFIESPSPTLLAITNHFIQGDPLAAAVQHGAPLGLLGIEISSRRRNRMNAHVSETQSDRFTVAVDQSFGNCPQYIQKRSVEFIREPSEVSDAVSVERFTEFNEATSAMIAAADTFFVSSYIDSATGNEGRPEIEGVDVSHRGGKPGFVKIEGNTLSVPDYPGNYHFNTLGNFLLNPKAGLVFLDFETGDVLQLTGSVELLLEDDAEIAAFKGAQRGWRVTLDHGVLIRGGLPFRSRLEEFSPNSLVTGDWEQAEATVSAQAKRDIWRPYRLQQVIDESSTIRSFYFEPVDGGGVLDFSAGQFLTVRLPPSKVAIQHFSQSDSKTDSPRIRTYTVSSAPGESYYRISVKREAEGGVSYYFHTQLNVGDVIDAKAPQGEFFIDPSERRPVVLIGGGVGITPMISMAQHVLNHGVLTRHLRPLTIFSAAGASTERAFNDDFRRVEKQSGGDIRYFSVLSKPASNEKAGVDFNGSGRITADLLRAALALDDYDFFLCGPAGFMQSVYDALLSLGVKNGRVFAEAFGPAALQRTLDVGVAENAGCWCCSDNTRTRTRTRTRTGTGTGSDRRRH